MAALTTAPMFRELLAASKTATGRLQIAHDATLLESWVGEIGGAAGAMAQACLGEESRINLRHPPPLLQLRVLRNVCVDCREAQSIIQECGAIDVTLSFVSAAAELLASDPAESSSPSSVQVTTDRTLEKALETAVQFLVNAVTGNEHNQAFLWVRLGFRENNEIGGAEVLVRLLVNCGRRGSDAGLNCAAVVVALLHNCCAQGGLVACTAMNLQIRTQPCGWASSHCLIEEAEVTEATLSSGKACHCHAAAQRLIQVVTHRVLICTLLRLATANSKTGYSAIEVDRESSALSEWLMLLFGSALGAPPPAMVHATDGRNHSADFESPQLTRSLLPVLWKGTGAGDAGLADISETPDILADMSEHEEYLNPSIVVTAEQMVLLELVAATLEQWQSEALQPSAGDEFTSEKSCTSLSSAAIEICVVLAEILQSFPTAQSLLKDAKHQYKTTTVCVMHHELNEAGRSLILNTLSKTLASHKADTLRLLQERLVSRDGPDLPGTLTALLGVTGSASGSLEGAPNAPANAKFHGTEVQTAATKGATTPGGLPATLPQQSRRSESDKAPRADVELPEGRKVELVRLLANLAGGSFVAQEALREAGAIVPLLNHCNIDGRNPMLREWGIFAVRNLCERNEGNQQLVRGLQPQALAPEMQAVFERQPGIDPHLHVDSATGKSSIRLRREDIDV